MACKGRGGQSGPCTLCPLHGAVTGHPLLIQPRVSERAAAAPTHGGNRRPAAAGTTHRGENGRARLLRALPGPPPGRASREPTAHSPARCSHVPTPPLPRKGPRRRPGPGLEAPRWLPAAIQPKPTRAPHVNAPSRRTPGRGRSRPHSPWRPAAPALAVPGAATNQRAPRQPHPPPCRLRPIIGGGLGPAALWERGSRGA